MSLVMTNSQRNNRARSSRVEFELPILLIVCSRTEFEVRIFNLRFKLFITLTCNSLGGRNCNLFAVSPKASMNARKERNVCREEVGFAGSWVPHALSQLCN